METLLVLELSDKIPNACHEFAGMTAWELPGFSTELSNGFWAAGWTECDMNRISFHTGDGFMFKDDQTTKRMAWHTAYVHEFIHAAQRCTSPMPIDADQNESHSNWSRDGLARIVYDIQGKMERK